MLSKVSADRPRNQRSFVISLHRHGFYNQIRVVTVTHRLAFPVSETSGSERDRVRGEFAREFLKAVHYDDDEIAMLGDLSRVSAAQVKELLIAKRDEIKKLEEIVRNPPPFGKLHEDKKP